MNKNAQRKGAVVVMDGAYFLVAPNCFRAIHPTPASS